MEETYQSNDDDIEKDNRRPLTIDVEQNSQRPQPINDGERPTYCKCLCCVHAPFKSTGTSETSHALIPAYIPLVTSKKSAQQKGRCDRS